MPAGEVLVELILGPVIEVLFFALTYGPGVLVIKVFSLGRAKILPLKTYWEGKQEKKLKPKPQRKPLGRPKKQKRRKNDPISVEATCVAGLAFWVALGLLIWLTVKYM